MQRRLSTMNLRPTAKAKKKNKKYQQQWLFLEPPWFFSEPTGTRFFSEQPSRVKSITNTLSFVFIFFFFNQYKVIKQDILAFHFTKIVGYKTHPDFGQAKFGLKNAAPYNQTKYGNILITIFYSFLQAQKNVCQGSMFCFAFLTLIFVFIVVVELQAVFHQRIVGLVERVKRDKY